MRLITITLLFSLITCNLTANAEYPARCRIAMPVMPPITQGGCPALPSPGNEIIIYAADDSVGQVQAVVPSQHCQTQQIHQPACNVGKIIAATAKGLIGGLVGHFLVPGLGDLGDAIGIGASAASTASGVVYAKSDCKQVDDAAKGLGGALAALLLLLPQTSYHIGSAQCLQRINWFLPTRYEYVFAVKKPVFLTQSFSAAANVCVGNMMMNGALPDQQNGYYLYAPSNSRFKYSVAYNQNCLNSRSPLSTIQCYTNRENGQLSNPVNCSDYVDLVAEWDGSSNAEGIVNASESNYPQTMRMQSPYENSLQIAKSYAALGNNDEQPAATVFPEEEYGIDSWPFTFDLAACNATITGGSSSNYYTIAAQNLLSPEESSQQTNPALLQSCQFVASKPVYIVTNAENNTQTENYLPNGGQTQFNYQLSTVAKTINGTHYVGQQVMDYNLEYAYNGSDETLASVKCYSDAAHSQAGNCSDYLTVRPGGNTHYTPYVPTTKPYLLNQCEYENSAFQVTLSGTDSNPVVNMTTYTMTDPNGPFLTQRNFTIAQQCFLQNTTGNTIYASATPTPAANDWNGNYTQTASTNKIKIPANATIGYNVAYDIDNPASQPISVLTDGGTVGGKPLASLTCYDASGNTLGSCAGLTNVTQQHLQDLYDSKTLTSPFMPSSLRQQTLLYTPYLVPTLSTPTCHIVSTSNGFQIQADNTSAGTFGQMCEITYQPKTPIASVGTSANTGAVSPKVYIAFTPASNTQTASYIGTTLTGTGVPQASMASFTSAGQSIGYNVAYDLTSSTESGTPVADISCYQLKSQVNNSGSLTPSSEKVAVNCANFFTVNPGQPLTHIFTPTPLPATS